MSGDVKRMRSFFKQTIPYRIVCGLVKRKQLAVRSLFPMSIWRQVEYVFDVQAIDLFKIILYKIVVIICFKIKVFILMVAMQIL